MAQSREGRSARGEVRLPPPLGLGLEQAHDVGVGRAVGPGEGAAVGSRAGSRRQQI